MRRPRTFPFLAPGRAPLPALPGSAAAIGAGIPMLDETAPPAYLAPAGGFGLPGLGLVAVRAISGENVDLLYGFLDPRIRVGSEARA